MTNHAPLDVVAGPTQPGGAKTGRRGAEFCRRSRAVETGGTSVAPREWVVKVGINQFRYCRYGRHQPFTDYHEQARDGLPL